LPIGSQTLLRIVVAGTEVDRPEPIAFCRKSQLPKNKDTRIKHCRILSRSFQVYSNLCPNVTPHHVDNTVNPLEFLDLLNSDPIRRLLPARAVSLLLMVLCLFTSGCKAGSKCYRELASREELRKSAPPVTFEYGTPNAVFDSVRTVAELPARLMTGGRLKVDHLPSQETQEVIADYMQHNQLTDVPVKINQYRPWQEWQRLRANQNINPCWKYTAGTVSMAVYTFLPGRVFGRDEYNAFTDSLYINSGRLTDSLHAAAYAKDVHNREAPGTYASVNLLPVVALWKTTRAVNDVVGYAQACESWELESGVYRDQYPQVAVKTVAPASFFLTPIGNVAMAVSGGAVGYIVGRSVEKQRLEERSSEIAAEKALRSKFASDDQPAGDQSEPGDRKESADEPQPSTTIRLTGHILPVTTTSEPKANLIPRRE
jgi:hypothetical protein